MFHAVVHTHIHIHIHIHGANRSLQGLRCNHDQYGQNYLFHVPIIHLLSFLVYGGRLTGPAHQTDRE